MTKLEWDQEGLRGFEIGANKGVLYPIEGSPIAWDGLLSVKDTSSGGTITSYFLEGQRFMVESDPESFSAGIECYVYPDVLTQGSFGMTYVTLLGNDLDGYSGGYLIHLIYNAVASYSEKNYKSSDSVSDLTTFGWDLSSSPMPVSGRCPSAHLIIDSSKTRPELLASFEELLYGTETTEPVLPDPDAVAFFFDDFCILRITDNGDGTWTATGPEDQISMLASDTFQIVSESAIFLDSENFTISSY